MRYAMRKRRRSNKEEPPSPCSKPSSLKRQRIRSSPSIKLLTVERTEKIDSSQRTEKKRRVLDVKRTPFDEARATLQLTSVPDDLPCREKERSSISFFIRKALTSINVVQQTRRGTKEAAKHNVGGSGKCLYIAGVPGTGKTATVRGVIRDLRGEDDDESDDEDESDSETEGSDESEEEDDDDDAEFLFVEINCRKMSKPDRAFTQLYGQLRPNRKGRMPAPERASEMLQKLLFEKGKPIVLLLDEIDFLLDRKQRVIYSFVDWAAQPRSRLILLGIANTLDLPERVLVPRVQSRFGLNRVTFLPYTAKELAQIISSRLESCKLFDAEAIKLVSKKIAAVTGDCRAALGACVRAVDHAERRIAEDESATTEFVIMKDVEAATGSMVTVNPQVFIEKESRHSKLFLTAMVKLHRLRLSKAITLHDAYQTYHYLCNTAYVPPLPISSMRLVASSLVSQRILLGTDFKDGFLQKMQLEIPPEVLANALRDEEVLRTVLRQ